MTREFESKQKAMRLVSLTHWQTGGKYNDSEMGKYPEITAHITRHAWFAQ